MNVAGLHRWIFVAESGDTEEVVGFTFRNDGDVPEDLGVSQVEFPYTDSTTDLVGAWSSDGIVQGAQLHRRGSSDIVVVPMSGQLARSDEHRTFGAHVRRRRAAEVSKDLVQLRDVSWKDPFSAHDAASFRVEIVVVLPHSYRRRQTHAPGSAITSSRVIAWRRPLDASKDPVALLASTGPLPPALRDFDDLLAQAYRTAASSLCQRPVASDWIDGPIAPRSHWPPSAIAAAAQAASARTAQDQLKAIAALLAARADVEQAARSCTTDAGVLEVTDVTMCTVARDASAVAMPVPRHLAEAVEGVVSFTASCGIGPTRWSTDSNEEDLERELLAHLAARGTEATNQPRAGNGRMDLMVRDAPLELKVGRFDGSVQALVARHGEQAAEYAVRRSRSVAVLVGLDMSASRGRLHGPELAKRILVRAVEGQGARTLVIGCLITAFPERPSSLRAPPRRRTYRTDNEARDR